MLFQVDRSDEEPPTFDESSDAQINPGQNNSCDGMYDTARCACLTDSWYVFNCEHNPNLKKQRCDKYKTRCYDTKLNKHCCSAIECYYAKKCD